ncbi:DUF2971 domain-containing protein [Providencia vermicola]|uniref:DUF2971 domain-containing protein n=1 Tax=Providencia vermicola TaxID=333965 RepID=UPI003D2846FC
MLVNTDQEKAELVLKGIKTGKYPESVYKYRTIKQASQILQNFQFFFSSAVNFNDPFDCALDEVVQYTPSDFSIWLSRLPSEITKEEKQKFKSLYENAVQEFNDKIKIIKNAKINKRGVLALSKTNENILLWSHYAENHTGVAIKLNITKDIEFFLTPINIEYTQKYTPLNFLENPEESIIHTLSKKSIDWEYEKELRIYKNSTGLQNINPVAITDVFFGVKSSQKDIQDIKNICNNNKLSHVNFYKAEKKHGEFAIYFNPI